MKFWTHEITEYEARAIMYSHKLIVTEHAIYEVRKNADGYYAYIVYTEKRPNRRLARKGEWFTATRNALEGWLGIRFGDVK